MIRSVSVALLLVAGCAAGDEPGSSVAREAVTTPASVPTWQPLLNPAPFSAGVSLLLTDGTLMVQDFGTSNWWRLTPDQTGSYRNGTWSQRAAMPAGYAPLYFASAVLPDGRVIVEGGEYINFTAVWSNLGAIYDPVADSWTAVAPPAGWTSIGDAQSVVLPSGTFMLANCCSLEQALFDATTLSWTLTGTGKQDGNDEEGWALLQDGTVLTVDANNPANPTQAELYEPATPRSPAMWVSAGNTPVLLADINPDGSGSHEIGPMLTRNDGTVVAIGATGHNAIYDPRQKTWSAADDFPVSPDGQLDSADGPMAQLPSGRMLVAASPGVFKAPSHFFELAGTHLTEVAAPPGATDHPSYVNNMLVLPTGEILLTAFSSDVELYTSASGATAPPGVAPAIDLVPSTLSPGNTYTLRGRRLNGLSQGAAYGDDFQMATNYPLVKITNQASGHVVFARTHNHSTMAIRNASSSTQFDVPGGIETGASALVVIANGNVSAPVHVTIRR